MRVKPKSFLFLVPFNDLCLNIHDKRSQHLAVEQKNSKSRPFREDGSNVTLSFKARALCKFRSKTQFKNTSISNSSSTSRMDYLNYLFRVSIFYSNLNKVKSFCSETYEPIRIASCSIVQMNPVTQNRTQLRFV